MLNENIQDLIYQDRPDPWLKIAFCRVSTATPPEQEEGPGIGRPVTRVF